MELNLNFVLFEEIKQESDTNEAIARIVILRESKNLDSSSPDCATAFDTIE